jgi:hypothetical protein
MRSRGLHWRSVGAWSSLGCIFMHILYLDDSGSVANANERYFVLGGIAVFERGIHHLIQQIDAYIDSLSLGDQAQIELHATDIYGGRKRPWSDFKVRADREAILYSILDIVAQRHQSFRLFAVAIDKRQVDARDPLELAFEEICNRFNLFLQRNHDRRGDHQKGLIVMDNTKHEVPLQNLARNFRLNGAKWGNFRYLSEVPFFVDSRATRMIQIADLVAWATWRRYEHEDGRFFDKVVHRFDAEGGVIHGLLHRRGLAIGQQCYCPACMSRRQR